MRLVLAFAIALLLTCFVPKALAKTNTWSRGLEVLCLLAMVLTSLIMVVDLEAAFTPVK